ncbi:MAG TPA: acyl-CoA dehydrogenase family protein [Mycobacteriales bacterium]|jgi:acyl-CoA dehydrogenase|nr:acyl-CoA dehydrogenase family protein [Mycobacteriales bacterium]
MSQPTIEASSFPGVDPLLLQTVTDLFGDLASPEQIRTQEGRWHDRLWSALAESGLAGIGVPESAGGSGGTTADAAAVLRLAGRFAVGLPLAEHALLGGWLVEAAGWELPAGRSVSVAPGAPHDTLTLSQSGDGWTAHGTVTRVPWGQDVAAVLALVQDGDVARIARLDPASATVTVGANLAAERRDTLAFDGAAADVTVAPAGVTRDALQVRGALTRTLLIAGALEGVSAETVAHAYAREQFGQPIARFQAIGQRLALLAEQTARAQFAADLATRALGTETADPLDAAVAKIVAGEAGTIAAQHAHQVCGAIGVSMEFDLQLLTRRVWSWRDEFGGETGWASRLGGALAEAGPDALWSWVSQA